MIWWWTSCLYPAFPRGSLLGGLSWDALMATTSSVYWHYCRKVDPFQGPKPGSCLTLGNELSKETHVLIKQEILLGKGTWVESSRVREPRRTALPRGSWLTVSGFMVMELVSGLSLANHSDSEFFLVENALFSQDGCQRGGFWEVVRHVVSPFDLSLTLPVHGGLLVPCSLPGPPVVKQLTQMVTTVPGRGGQFQSVCFPQQYSRQHFPRVMAQRCRATLKRGLQ